jgi:hypothetical protein
VWVGDLIQNQEGAVRHLLGQASQGWLRQGFRFNQGALVHGIVPQTAIEILWQDAFMNDLAGGEAALEPALGVAAEDNLTNDPPGIGERRLNGVDAKDEEAVTPLGSLTCAVPMALPVVHAARVRG